MSDQVQIAFWVTVAIIVVIGLATWIGSWAGK